LDGTEPFRIRRLLSEPASTTPPEPVQAPPEPSGLPPKKPATETSDSPSPPINSASSLATPLHADGPEAPRWLWWQDQRQDIAGDRGRLLFDLLQFMWDRDSATFDDLTGPGKPWPQRPSNDSAYSTTVNRLNIRLPSALPWKLGIQNYC